MKTVLAKLIIAFLALVVLAAWLIFFRVAAVLRGESEIFWFALAAAAIVIIAAFVIVREKLWRSE